MFTVQKLEVELVHNMNLTPVWKIINERYWELEMNKFKGFDEFNFFRAVNPAFHLEKEEKKAGIVVGDQDTFQMYKELYDCEYSVCRVLSRRVNIICLGSLFD